MATTVADVMAATLKASGVRRVYGIPGDSLNGFTRALRQDGTIGWEHVRYEEAAGFAAAAQAALTGELAVCAASCGPGNLHLINGLFDANRSGTPVLAIAAHIPSAEIGGEYFQETHPQELFRECSVYCELVSVPAQLPRILVRCLDEMTAGVSSSRSWSLFLTQKSMFRGCDVGAMRRNLSLLDACAAGAQRAESDSSLHPPDGAG